MTFFIIAAVIIALASAHLLHQFWTRALIADEERGAHPEPDARGEQHLRAA